MIRDRRKVMQGRGRIWGNILVLLNLNGFFSLSLLLLRCCSGAAASRMVFTLLTSPHRPPLTPAVFTAPVDKMGDTDPNQSTLIDASMNDANIGARIADKLSMQEAAKLVSEAKTTLSTASVVLDQARSIASKWGLSVDSSILEASYQSSFLPARFRHGLVNEATIINEDPAAELINGNKNCVVLSTTGGHSNTNHVILSTGNPFADKLFEYKRIYKRRAKAMQPEQRGADRWDQPRVQGSRRRRITREVDLPYAPPEPPNSGYVVFVGQMTIKMRHDRPNVKHNQINAVGEISKIWKFDMSENERAYYNNFSKEAREEYKKQYREFRATGVYTKSTRFEKLENAGPWVHISDQEKNALEKELASYPTVVFPPRPPNLDDQPRPTVKKNTGKKKKSGEVSKTIEGIEQMTSIPDSNSTEFIELMMSGPESNTTESVEKKTTGSVPHAAEVTDKKDLSPDSKIAEPTVVEL